MIIPVRGPVIMDPDVAIDTLIDRVQRLYRNYLSTNAYRWYRGLDHHISLSKRMQLDTVNWMPLAETRENPLPWLTHINNSIFIHSKTGKTFPSDCGFRETYEMFLDGAPLSKLDIEGIFITHYHDDHTEFVPDLVERYNCPVYIREQLEDILLNPLSYRLPCMISKPIPNIKVVQCGYFLQWEDPS